MTTKLEIAIFHDLGWLGNGFLNLAEQGKSVEIGTKTSGRLSFTRDDGLTN